MAWSGGTFTRVGGATHWVDDKNAAINIVASRHDTNDQDIATGINDCLTRDNQSKPTVSFLPNADNSLDLGALATRWRTLFAVAAQFGDGAVGTPAISFTADTDTGVYRPGADQVAIATGGTRRLNISANFFVVDSGQLITTTDGTAAAPVYSFNSDPDTGFYRDTANQIAIALGGSAAGQIAQGSFTGTLTGYAANPTGTVKYQRIGNMAMLWVSANITGTSNATSLTLTGLPAVVQPAGAVSVPCWGVVSAGSSFESLAQAQIAAGGSVVTFNLATNAPPVIASQSPANVSTKGLITGWTIVYPLS